MNKHIELVKKWLADPESVTQKELEDNLAATKQYYAVNKHNQYLWFDGEESSIAVIYAAAYASYVNTAYVDDGFTAEAKYWVKRYEELKE
jgi:hypothetical protein